MLPDPNEPLIAVCGSPALAVGRQGLVLRAGTVKRLMLAANALPKGFAVLVIDAWRSREQQAAVGHTRAPYPAGRSGSHPQPVMEALERSDFDPPHRTGGAVDVTLLGPDRRPWPMNTCADPGSLSATDAFEDLARMRPLSVAEEQARVGRDILRSAMTAAGFTNYPPEWWHYDFGNAFWRHFSGYSSASIYRTVD